MVTLEHDLNAVARKIREAEERATHKPAAQAATITDERAKSEAARKKRSFHPAQIRLCSVLPWITQPEGLTLDGYRAETVEQKRAVMICRRFVDSFADRLIKGTSDRGILFTGRCGTGKTHLACGILDGLKRLDMPGFFIPAIELFDLYTPSFAEGFEGSLSDLRARISRVSCLVIDDVGADAWTAARRSRLQQTVDQRSANGLPTIITTNVSKADFAEGAGQRITSRFQKSLYPVVCDWADYRETHAIRKLSPEEVF